LTRGPSDTGTSQQDQQLSAQQRPKAKPDYGDKQKALQLLERCRQDAKHNMPALARRRADLYNLKLERGGEDNHWVVWDNQAGTYVRRPDDDSPGGLPKWFHRATSNLLANKTDGIAAILNQSQPAKNWYATRDDDRSRATADVCEIADPVLLDEIDYPHGLRPRLNKLTALTSAAAVVVTYDNDPKWGTDSLPLLQCQQCQQIVNPLEVPDPEEPCPDCGGQLDWAENPQQPGLPLGMDYPKGRLNAELISSFELSLPRTAQVCHEEHLPWVLTHQRWDLDDAVSRWPQLQGKITHDAPSGAASKASDQAMADQARDLAAPVANTRDQSAGGGGQKGPIIYRLWHDPIVDDEFNFPDGLFLTTLEGDSPDDVLECTPLPFKDDEGRPFKNVLLRAFVNAPASPHGKPPADDLAPLQVQLNLALALGFLILMHHASPRTFIPSTVTINDKLTGMPGKNVGYRSYVPGDKPIVEPGVGFPDSLKWFIEFIVQAFDTVSKLNAVLMGERPQGDPTLGEVEILQERGFAAFQEPLESLVQFERRLSMKLLWVTKECGWSERYRRILGDDGQWKLQAFTGADLDGHVTVDIDLATAWPKSPMLTNMRVAKAFELGILNPQDPEVQEEYLKLNDLLQFKKSTDADQDQVNRQLDVWRQATDPSQIEPPQSWWRLDYHLYRKTQFLKTETFEQLQQQNPPVAQAMLAHVGQLHQMLAPPMPAEPAAAPQKGDKGALPHAVQSGAVVPARGKGAKGALGRAAQAGVIHPKGTAAAVRKAHGPNVGDLVKAGAIRPKAPQAAMSPGGTVGAPTAPGAAS
jgi:hypothetical protein